MIPAASPEFWPWLVTEFGLRPEDDADGDAEILPVGEGEAPTAAEVLSEILNGPHGQHLIDAQWQLVVDPKKWSASDGWYLLEIAVLRAVRGHGAAGVDFLLHTAWGRGLVHDSRDPSRFTRRSWVERDLARVHHKTHASNPAAVFTALPPLPAPASMFMDATDVAKLPPVEWRVAGLLPERCIAMLATDQSVGKSFLALDLALRLQHGMPFLGLPVEPGSTLFFAGEGHAGLAARIRAWQRMHLLAPRAVEGRYCAISREVPLLTASTVPQLAGVVRAEAVARGHAPALVVIDTLSQCLGDDENDAKTVAPVMRGLTQLREEFGCAILIVHHLVKLNTHGNRKASPTLDAIRGSGVLTRNIDTVIGGWRGADGSRQLAIWKQKDGEALHGLRFSLLTLPTGVARQKGDRGVETSCVVVLSPPALVAGVSTDPDPDAELRRKEDADIERLVAALRREGQFTTRDGVGAAAGMTCSRARIMLDLAVQRGRIVDRGKPKRPKFMLPEEGGETPTPLGVRPTDKSAVRLGGTQPSENGIDGLDGFDGLSSARVREMMQ